MAEIRVDARPHPNPERAAIVHVEVQREAPETTDDAVITFVSGYGFGFQMRVEDARQLAFGILRVLERIEQA